MAETLNQPDGGDKPDGKLSAEVAAVTKQTMETLMAGERIMEALDLADNERATLRDFEDQKARAGTLEAAGLQPPPRNPLLAALDLDPEGYVLRVVEKIPRTALYDALLVLPFGKVLSLMQYLDIWAKKVCFWVPEVFCCTQDWPTSIITGQEYCTRLIHRVLPPQNSSSPDRGQSYHADNVNSDAN